MNKDECLQQIRIWSNEAREIHPELEEQKKYLRRTVMKNKNVTEMLLDIAIADYGYKHLYAARHIEKMKINKAVVHASGNNPAEPKVKTKTQIKTYQRIKKTILDKYACGSKMIGDCTYSEVFTEAMTQRNRGNGMLEQASIFTAVYSLMSKSENKTVRECIKPEIFMQIINKFKAVA